MDSMLAGLCNICNDYGYENFNKLRKFLESMPPHPEVSAKCSILKKSVDNLERFMKHKLPQLLQRHSPCIDLCMSYALSDCKKSHDKICEELNRKLVVDDLKKMAKNYFKDEEQKTLLKDVDNIEHDITMYISHIIRTKHQGSYYQYILSNLSTGEVVVIADYKMKIEVGKYLREIQRDWYGKRGISVHGILFIIAQPDGSRKLHILDLWSNDSKQDAWFTCSAFDIGFSWLENTYPNSNVYLFSDNGPHYHNSTFLVYLSGVNKAFNKIKLMQYNTFEAGEGKTILDTHFAHLSHKIVRYVCIGKNILGGEDLQNIISSIKNTTCQELIIDRARSVSSIGTFKDISCLNSFDFSTSGPHANGIIARSLAGMGMKKTLSPKDVHKLLKSNSSFTGKTGATTTSNSLEQPNTTQPELNLSNDYTIRYLQSENTPSLNTEDYLKDNSNASPLPYTEPGYAIKQNNKTRVTFTNEQKAIMIAHYKAQQSSGLRAVAENVIRDMQAHGLQPLTSKQITSFWSTYHQKVKRQLANWTLNTVTNVFT